MNKPLAALLVILSSTSVVNAQTLTGKASFYRGKGPVACAHRTLPFGTKVRVTNRANGRATLLVVNDRGPFIRGRIIDVSTRAADLLGFRRAGVADVTVETVSN